MTIKRCNTQNSVYIIDDGLKRYQRLPKTEAPRKQDASWRLADGVWIDYETIEAVLHNDTVVLHIMTADAVYGVYTSEIESAFIDPSDASQ